MKRVCSVETLIGLRRFGCLSATRREAIDAADVEVGLGGGAHALAAGRAALPEYGSRFSHRDYTQPQLFALLVLRQFLRTDYRGVVVLVAEWSELQRALGLTKVPHYSTLAHASRRILVDAEAGGPSCGPNPLSSGGRALAA